MSPGAEKARLAARIESRFGCTAGKIVLHDKGLQVFSLFHLDNPILSVDVFTNHPIEFDHLHDRSETCNVSGVSVWVASIPDLIFLKRLADRPRDRDDIETLKIIARLKGNRDEPREDT